MGRLKGPIYLRRLKKSRSKSKKFHVKIQQLCGGFKLLYIGQGSPREKIAEGVEVKEQIIKLLSRYNYEVVNFDKKNNCYQPSRIKHNRKVFARKKAIRRNKDEEEK